MTKKFLVTQTVTYYINARDKDEAQNLAEYDRDEINHTIPGRPRPTLDTQVEEV